MFQNNPMAWTLALLSLIFWIMILRMWLTKKKFLTEYSSPDMMVNLPRSINFNYLFFSTLGIILAIVCLYFYTKGNSTNFYYFDVLFYFSIAAYWFLARNSYCIIAPKGFLRANRIVPWSMVEGFFWQDYNRTDIITFKLKKAGIVRVGVDHPAKKNFEKLVQEHVKPLF